MSIYDTGIGRGWIVLIHAHDHVWQQRSWQLAERLNTCLFLHLQSLKLQYELEEMPTANIENLQAQCLQEKP